MILIIYIFNAKIAYAQQHNNNNNNTHLYF